MAPENHDDKTHSISAVWDRVNQQSDLIGQLAQSQAATEANLAALASSVESGFNQINHSLSRVIDRENRPTNWVGIGSLFLFLFATLIAFVALQTDPVRVKTFENAQMLNATYERELKYAESHGAMLAEIENLKAELNKVDQFGSRRWIRDRE